MRDFAPEPWPAYRAHDRRVLRRVNRRRAATFRYLLKSDLVITTMKPFIRVELGRARAIARAQSEAPDGH